MLYKHRIVELSRYLTHNCVVFDSNVVVLEAFNPQTDVFGDICQCKTEVDRHEHSNRGNKEPQITLLPHFTPCISTLLSACNLCEEERVIWRSPLSSNVLVLYLREALLLTLAQLQDLFIENCLVNMHRVLYILFVFGHVAQTDILEIFISGWTLNQSSTEHLANLVTFVAAKLEMKGW